MSETLALNTAPASGRRQRILVVVLVAVLLAFLLPKVLFGGGDGGAELETQAPPPETGQADPPEASDTPLLPSSSGRTGTDPFEALISQAAVAANAGDASIVPPDPIPAVELPPLEPAQPLPIFLPGPLEPTPVPAPAPGPTAPALPGPAPRVERQIELIEIYVDGTGLDAATVRVDDQFFEIAIGQEFAESYRALGLDVDSNCGVFLYGTRRFSLCEGEQRTT